MTIAKSFNITESKKMQFSARFINIFNHPQYVGGFISDVAPIAVTRTGRRGAQLPGTAVGNLPAAVAGVFEQSAATATRAQVHLLKLSGRLAGSLKGSLRAPL